MSEVYKDVYISFKISATANQLLSELAEKSGRSKKKEAKFRLESNLILEKTQTISTRDSFSLVSFNNNRSCKDVGFVK